MHGLLAPLLAQLVTLAVGDRIEGHYLVSRDDHYFESSNSSTAGGALSFAWRRSSLTFTYAPTLQLFPLYSTIGEKFEHLESQRAGIAFQYRWRSTTLSVNSGGTYARRDFAEEAISAGQPIGAVPGPNQPAQPQQVPGAGTPTTGMTGTTPPTGGQTGTTTTGTGTTAGTGTTQQANAATAALSHNPVDYVTARSSIGLDHSISRVLSWRIGVAYTIAGGLGPRAQTDYPLVRGPDGSISVRAALDTRNLFATTFVAQAVDGAGNDVLMMTLGEDYTHSFTRQLVGTVGAGVSFSRTVPSNVTLPLPLYSVYPTARALVADSSRLGHGMLTLSTGVSTTPVLDYTTVSVDPRIAFFGTAAWHRDRFGVTLTTSTQLSLATAIAHAEATTPATNNAFSAAFVGLDFGYTLPGNFIASGGVRGAWQRLGNTDLLLPSAIFYVALSWGAVVPLNSPHH